MTQTAQNAISAEQEAIFETETETENFLIGPYEFAGPFEKGEDVKELSGLCVVLSQNDEDYNLLEIFCTDNARLAWRRFEGRGVSRKNKNLKLAVHYDATMPEIKRNRIVENIMNELSVDNSQQLSFADLAGSIYIIKTAPLKAISA